MGSKSSLQIERVGGLVGGFFNYREGVMSVFIGNESLIELDISACLSRETPSKAQSAICYLCHNYRITACLNE